MFVCSWDHYEYTPRKDAEDRRKRANKESVKNWARSAMHDTVDEDEIQWLKGMKQESNVGRKGFRYPPSLPPFRPHVRERRIPGTRIAPYDITNIPDYTTVFDDDDDDDLDEGQARPIPRTPKYRITPEEIERSAAQKYRRNDALYDDKLDAYLDKRLARTRKGVALADQLKDAEGRYQQKQTFKNRRRKTF